MDFLTRLRDIINTGQSRCVILAGNVHDLFFDGKNYVPLIDHLTTKCMLKATVSQKGITQIVYATNRPVEIIGEENFEELKRIWSSVRKDEKKLEDRLSETTSNSVYSFELLRQISEATRNAKNTKNNLLIFVDSADMLVPESEVSRMSLPDRKQVAVLQDFFSDPQFLNGHDSIVLIAESRSGIHQRISRLPQILSVEVPLPSLEDRKHFIHSFKADSTVDSQTLAEQTSGLSIHAIRQLLLSGNYSMDNVAVKVEEYMTSQLGDDVIEFKRPTHLLKDLIGFRRLKPFLINDLIPAFKTGSITGVGVGGPIGGGKTYICEAVAGELGLPVIVLKNIRSKWYGDTDKIFERLYRLAESFYRLVIFVDEADTMFGDINSDQETERRLTGKIQAMMSDTRLKGKVIWFLMTARIHRLSPDIRRPGRMDMIIPILDPEDKADIFDFVCWAYGDLMKNVDSNDTNFWAACNVANGWSAASFSMLRSRLKRANCSTLEEALKIANDIISPDIENTRLYQTLQAKLNCTSRSLLVPEGTPQIEFDKLRLQWREQLKELESKGIN